MPNQEQPIEQNSPIVYEGDISEEAATERRYLWMARTFALVAVVSFLSTLILLIALFSLLPIVRVQPFYLTTLNKDQQVIRVIRPNFNNINMQMLSESLIRQYLLARMTVNSNISEMEQRWGIDGIINWMSSPVVFEEFGRTAETALNQARNDGLTRAVKILNITPYKTEKNGTAIWRAEIELTDLKYGDSEPVRSLWQITLRIRFKPTRQGLKWEQRLKNPLGFTVENFGIQRK